MALYVYTRKMILAFGNGRPEEWKTEFMACVTIISVDTQHETAVSTKLSHKIYNKESTVSEHIRHTGKASILDYK